MKIRKDLDKVYSNIVKREDIRTQVLTQIYDSYTVAPLQYYFPQQYINELKTISKSVRDIADKYKDVEKLMNLRGFKLMKGGGGTNRRVYECLYDPRILAKVSLDEDGANATIRDFMNQNIAKPFCTKIFEIDPSGTISIIERVIPIMTKEEWKAYWADIFEVLFFGFRRRDIGIEDVGDSRIKNWGYRNGFGPVLLDFPSVYRLDPTKSRCLKVVNGHICGGTIDYDGGFNKLICTSCGERYFAKNLALKEDYNGLNSLGQAMNNRNKFFEEEINMRFTITDTKTGVEEERGSVGKSHCINNKRSFINKKNYNIPEQEEKKRTKKLHFTIEDEVVTTPVIETKDEVVTTPVVETKDEVVTTPVIETKDGVVTTPVVEKKDDEKTKSLFSATNYPSFSRALQGITYCYNIDDMIHDLENIAIEAALEFEGDENNNQKSPANLYKIIKSRMIGINNSIPMPKLVDLYREVSKDTLVIPDGENHVLLCDDFIDETRFNLVGKMLDRIYSGTNISRFDAFLYLINTVRNTLQFFEGIVGFYNYIVNRFSYEIDEAPGASKEYRLNKEVYELMIDKIESAIDDYLFNVKYNFNNLTYNINNEFTFFRKGLEELKIHDDFEPGNWIYKIYTEPKYCDVSVMKNDEEECIHDITNDDKKDSVFNVTNEETGETENPEIQINEAVEDETDKVIETEEKTANQKIQNDESSFEEKVSNDIDDVYISESNDIDTYHDNKKLTKKELKQHESEERKQKDKEKYKAIRDDDETYNQKKNSKYGKGSNKKFKHKSNKKFKK
jgi:hypothetical protein